MLAPYFYIVFYFVDLFKFFFFFCPISRRCVPSGCKCVLLRDLFQKPFSRGHCVLGNKTPIVEGFYATCWGREGHKRTLILRALSSKKTECRKQGGLVGVLSRGSWVFKAAFHFYWTVAMQRSGDGNRCFLAGKTPKRFVFYS